MHEHLKTVQMDILIFIIFQQQGSYKAINDEQFLDSHSAKKKTKTYKLDWERQRLRYVELSMGIARLCSTVKIEERGSSITELLGKTFCRKQIKLWKVSAT